MRRPVRPPFLRDVRGRVRRWRWALRQRGPRGARARRWARGSLAAVRADLTREGMATRCAPPVPALPGWSRVVVERVLQEQDATCLQRCLVLQAWFAAHGREAEIVVAVPTATQPEFSAHAWIRGYDRDEHDRYRELTVLRP